MMTTDASTNLNLSHTVPDFLIDARYLALQKFLEKTDARNDVALNRALGQLKDQLDIALLRCEISAAEWAIRNAYHDIRVLRERIEGVEANLLETQEEAVRRVADEPWLSAELAASDEQGEFA